MIRFASGWGLLMRPSLHEVDAFLNGIRLLNREEMQKLFPDCEIISEKVFGWTKCYIAVRPGN